MAKPSPETIRCPHAVACCGYCVACDDCAPVVSRANELREKLAAVTAERDALKAELATLKQEHGPFVERGVYLSLKSNHRAAVAGSVSAKAQVEALKAECERKDSMLRYALDRFSRPEREPEYVCRRHSFASCASCLAYVMGDIRAALAPAQTKPEALPCNCSPSWCRGAECQHCADDSACRGGKP